MSLKRFDLLGAGAAPLVLIALNLGASCSLKPPSDGTATVYLSLDAPALAQNPPRDLTRLLAPAAIFAPPEQTSGFNCFAVNVMGPGIPDADPDGHGPGPNGILAGYSATDADDKKYCSYAGVLSPALTPSGGAPIELELQVPTGPNRIVQMLGIMNGGSCPSNLLSAPNAEVFVLADEKIGLFGDRAVHLVNTYPTAGVSGFNGLSRRAGCGDVVHASRTCSANSVTSITLDVDVTPMNGASAIRMTAIEFKDSGGTAFAPTGTCTSSAHLYDASPTCTASSMSQPDFVTVSYTYRMPLDTGDANAPGPVFSGQKTVHCP